MTGVIIVGGAGFIGRNLGASLRAQGRKVRAWSRAECDLTRLNADEVGRALADADCVVNCAGALAGGLDTIHVRGTALLVEACRRAGVKRLIHISALGADASGHTEFHKSKERGEAVLANARDLDVCVVRPSIVIGRGGASTALFGALAALPVVPRIASGPIAPVGIDDLCDAVIGLIDQDAPLPPTLDAVGPDALSFDQIVDALGGWLRLPKRRDVRLPDRVLMALTRIGELLRLGPVNRESLAMLRAGNVADAAAIAAALGRAPLPIEQTLARHPAASADRLQARLYFVRPMLRLSLAALWLATGVLSFGLYPVEQSRALLDQIGLHGGPASAALYGGAGLDLLLGLLLLAGRRIWTVGALMLATMVAFTGLALRLPAELWLHPFAPLLKNLPIAAAIVAMMAMEA